MNFSDLWVELSQSTWWNWLTEMRVLASVAGVVLFMALAWLAAWQHKRRRVFAMLVAVNDATFGRCLPRSRTGAWGFVVGIEPAPERFREFNISYQPLSIFDPLDLMRLVFRNRRTTFFISGVLLEAPTAEVIWMRRQPPTRVLGQNPGRTPWVQGRLDFAGAEYATRGTNVGAVKHLLQDMVARFTPILMSVLIQRERRPHFQMVVEGKIEPRDVSPLITYARGLGRAAMME